MSPWWLLVCFSIFLIGVTKSGFGSGMGLLNVPIMVIATSHIAALTNRAALGLMLPMLIIGDLIAIWQYRDQFDLSIIKRLLVGTVIGVILGGGLLWLFEKQQKELVGILINLEIGFESVLLVSIHWYRNWRAAHQKPYHASRVKSFAVGAFAGVSSTLAHGAGPIIALHLLPQKLERRLFVVTCSIYFAMLNIIKVPAYAWAGQFSAENNAPISFSIRFAPLVVLGALVGYWLNKKMSDAFFSKVVYLATFLLGIYLLIVSGLDLRAYLKAS